MFTELNISPVKCANVDRTLCPTVVAAAAVLPRQALLRLNLVRGEEPGADRPV
jgi:hypothetical protein